MQRFRELAPGVHVATEQELTTNSTAVAHPGGGCLLIDPAVSAAALTEAEHDLLAENLRTRSPGHELDLAGRLTALPDGTGLIPWDGPEAQLVVHDGHAPGHAAVFFPHTGVLVAGDMLSDMEIPILATERDEALAEYRTGLDKLAGVREVRWLVPGHGQVTDAAGFRARVDADRRYLDRLEARRPFDDARGLPGWLAEQHRQQSEYVAARSA